MNQAKPPSDPIYKRLYAFARMVEDLLRSLFNDDQLGADDRTLEKLSTEYVGDALRQRHGDTARPNGRVGSLLRKLRTPKHRGWPRVLVLLEFDDNPECVTEPRQMAGSRNRLCEASMRRRAALCR